MGEVMSVSEMNGSTVLRQAVVERYLADRHGQVVRIESLRALGRLETGPAALKQFGYGSPLLVSYRVGAQRYEEVIHTIRRNQFGRERADDRLAAAWLDRQTFDRLPRHVPLVDLARLHDQELRSLEPVDSLHPVTTYRPGRPYAEDLQRLRDGGALETRDQARVRLLATYLAEIHQVSHDDAWLWRRRLRDLIGHGEGIMGLTDSYPDDFELAGPDRLERLECLANAWRWRLKPLTHRLRQVHGDFHPFNLIFDGDALHVLDRSRGEWGEAADDVSCLSINYLFFALQRSDRLEGPLADLHELFWQTYLDARPDQELLTVIQPWLAWRALVLANPLWYPSLDARVRRRLLALASNVLQAEQYDYQQVERYWNG